MDSVKDFLKDIEAFFNSDKYFSMIVSKTIIILFTIVATFIILRIINRVIKKRMEITQKNRKSLYLLLRMLLKFVILVICFTIIISQFDILDSLVTTILTASGIAALAVGIAAQESLANLIGGVSVTLNENIEIGDFIKIVDKNIKATVEEITLRHTILRTINNRMMLVPNKIMATSIIENYSNNDEVCYFFEVGISYNSDIDVAISIIKQAINAHKDTYKPKGVNAEEYPKVKIINFGDSSVDLRAWVWINEPSIAYDKICDLRRTVKEAFDANGVEIPYKYTNLIIKRDNK